MLSDEDCSELLLKFPQVEAAFAYGSGAVKQEGYRYDGRASTTATDVNTCANVVANSNPSTTSGAQEEGGGGVSSVVSVDDGGASLPMVDLLLVVKDPVSWHKENIALNRDHYTLLSNPLWIAYLQENIGGGMWFNAMLPMQIRRYPRRSMKYGVISMSRFEQDCRQWTDLYIAGRCHKPVVPIKSNERVDAILEYNRSSALVAALCLLPPEFNEFDLYAGIAGVSYTNDPRMGLGENPNKVVNLVKPIIGDYRKLYANHLAKLTPSINLRQIANGGLYLQDMSPAVRLNLIDRLPPFLKSSLYSQCGNTSVISPTFIRGAIGSIVARAARGQFLKGIVTTGVFKGVQYVWAKVKKTIAAASASKKK